ncbi:MAG: hypothetical protein K0Q95_3217 [Bacteroidota bacterium]|jgi:tetratricopeptide (TPR) repeat protein|nr:hypothetical protein [Bacteroidota bacterium]
MQELRFKIKLNFKDYLNFQFAGIKQRFLPITVFLIFIIVIAVVPVLISDVRYDYTSLLMIGLYITVIPAIVLVSTYYNARNVFQNDKILQKEQEFIFSSNGIQIQDASSDVMILWNEVYKTQDTRNNVLIYTSPSKSIILPKRYLNEHEKEVLHAAFKANVTPGTKTFFLKKPRIIIYSIYLIIAIYLVFKTGVFGLSKTPLEIGYAKEQAGDYEGAILEYDKAINAKNGDKKLYNQRGHAKGMLKDYQGAQADCSIAIKLDPNYGPAYYNRASAKYFLNDNEGACEDFYKAQSLGVKEATKAIAQTCN